ncbi:MAG: MBL fold metallo-hydrolase [Chlorobi bacterium]|nr:MBL fold metallo-hydrolase [Chlorobiota bacterium]
MTIQQFEFGPVDTIGYIIHDGDSSPALIIDAPMDSSEAIVSYVARHSLSPVALILTHGHWDHTGNAASICKRLKIPAWIHELDNHMMEHPEELLFDLPFEPESYTADRFLENGEKISCGNLSCTIHHVPGHTPGHVVIHFPDEGVVFAGDVLFMGSVGRTDLPGGDYDTLMQSIIKKLLSLPGDTQVLPGHGPPTTIAREMQSNPFIINYREHSA